VASRSLYRAVWSFSPFPIGAKIHFGVGAPSPGSCGIIGLVKNFRQNLWG
jgi:hypothetical protein